MAAETRVRLGLSCSLALVMAVRLPAAQESPAMASPFVELGGPHDIALGEVTGDGVVDVLVSRSDGAVFVCPGRGDGELLAPIPVLSLSGYATLGAVDLNGDAVDEIVVAEHDPATVHLVVSGGDGTFEVSDSFPLPSRPTQLLPEDWDEDADADLAVMCPSAGQIVFLFNTGDAHVGASTMLDVGAGALGGKRAAAGDATGDGHLDLVLSDLSGNAIIVHRGDGTGSFPDSYDLDVQLPANVVLGDFNADGALDIVAPVFFMSTLQVLWNRGDGDFLPPIVVGSAGLNSPIVGDLNEDGLEDLFGSTVYGVTVLLADSPGPFASARHFGIGASAGKGRSAVADMNSDGDLDVVVGGQGSATAPLTVLLGSGDGSLRPVSRGVQGDVAFADVDGNGWLDIIGLYEPSYQLAVLPGLGFGAFGPPVLTPTVYQAHEFELADFNEDGRTDCLVAGQGPASLHLGNGEVLGPQILLWDGGPTLVKIGTGDLDGDGHEDAVSACGSLLRVLLGDGDATFTALPDAPVQWQPTDLVVAHLDDDGILDVALGYLDSSPSGVAVLLGRGDGTFEAPAMHVTAPVLRLDAGDLDHDGDVDLVACSPPTGTVLVLLNAGDGSFSSGDDVVLAWPSVGDLELADLDRDGVLDLATVSADSPTWQGMLELHRGLGDGRFSKLDEMVVQQKAFDLTAADVDADGAPDLAVSRGPSILFNRAGPWTKLGGALGGSGGQPKLAATGTLIPDSTFVLHLSEAPPAALAWLVIGLRTVSIPFKGGVLVPSPDIVIGPWTSDSRGTLRVALPWPARGAPAVAVHQFWIQDAGGPFGCSASNALQGEGQ